MSPTQLYLVPLSWDTMVTLTPEVQPNMGWHCAAGWEKAESPPHPQGRGGGRECHGLGWLAPLQQGPSGMGVG